MIKVVNKACQAMVALCCAAALVFYFLDFAKLYGGVSVSGLQLAFGEGELYISSKILFSFLLGVLGLALAVFSFISKSKVLKYVLTGDLAVVAVYTLVMSLRAPYKYVDARPVVNTINTFNEFMQTEYASIVRILPIVMFVALIFCVAHVLISDKIMVMESKGSQKPLLKRIAQFFKDYKSETKKIVWPGLREVIKNTGIVLIMFVVIGAIIWLIDFGLGSAIKGIWK